MSSTSQACACRRFGYLYAFICVMAFSFKLRSRTGHIHRVTRPRRSPPSPPSPPSDTPTTWISWLVDVFGVNWPVDRRTPHRPEARCIINPTVGWPHDAPTAGARAIRIADHPVCTIANQPADRPKTSTYIFSRLLHLLEARADTTVARRHDLKHPDVGLAIKEDGLHGLRIEYRRILFFRQSSN